MKKLALLSFTIFCSVSTLFAQSGNVDFLRSMGKIYVVVAVIGAIFLGIVFFLIFLDRKLTKLENQINNNDQTTS